MIADELFQDRLKTDLVRVGLPVAASYISSGIWLETIDGRPPAVFLKWCVHSGLRDHFTSLSHAELLNDPQVQSIVNAQRAMYTAITAILEFAGYEVHEAGDERPGELMVTRTAEPTT